MALPRYLYRCVPSHFQIQQGKHQTHEAEYADGDILGDGDVDAVVVKNSGSWVSKVAYLRFGNALVVCVGSTIQCHHRLDAAVRGPGTEHCRC